MVAAPYDAGNYVSHPGNCGNTFGEFAFPNEIGSGLQNSLTWVEACGNSYTPSHLALDFEANGYNDWYLPSIDELREMQQTIGGSDNIGSNVYWSSSAGNGIPWCMMNYIIWMTDGYVTTNSTCNNLSVRPIRSF